MNRRGMNSPSGGAMIFGADLVQPVNSNAVPEARGNVKLVRVGDQLIPLTRAERKQVMRKLVKLGIERGDTPTATPAHHSNRRSERD